ncbi:MAG: hypothetical protein ACI9MR_002190 [Myxococcota bacterium]|jgi:hypothetical protein
MSGLFDTLVRYLEEDTWTYEVHGAGENRRIALRFEGEHVQVACWLVVYEETERICFISAFPVVVPEDMRPAIAEYLTRANHGVVMGNFEMDYDDGAIHFRTSVDVEGIEVTKQFIKNNLLVVNLGTADRYFPGLMKVLYAGMTPADAVAVTRGVH